MFQGARDVMQDRGIWDVAVVGGGIVGLGVAWAARKRGESVLVLERSARAQGASIRNFGMIWPIGQPLGERRDLAMRNRELWIDIARQTGIFFESCGSLHVAHHEDEMQVIRELVASDASGLQQLDREETLSRSRGVQRVGLVGAMWSPWECRVDPRQAIAGTAAYLESLGVRLEYSQSVRLIEDQQLVTTDAKRYTARRIFVCSGEDFQSLYPTEHRHSGMKRCKLQMMRTLPLKAGFQLGPHLASGLTLRHYEAFRQCPSLVALRQRIASQQPMLDRFGIHVMASQSRDGEIVLGDSHLYDDEIEPFELEEIDRLILEECQKVFDFPEWAVQQRWSGIYAKHPTQAWFHQKLDHGVEILNGFGGSGMSMSLAVSERIVNQT
jgi:FAD dependent oxidoreductase TIGR03364